MDRGWSQGANKGWDTELGKEWNRARSKKMGTGIKGCRGRNVRDEVHI